MNEISGFYSKFVHNLTETKNKSHLSFLLFHLKNYISTEAIVYVIEWKIQIDYRGPTRFYECNRSSMYPCSKHSKSIEKRGPNFSFSWKHLWRHEARVLHLLLLSCFLTFYLFSLSKRFYFDTYCLNVTKITLLGVGGGPSFILINFTSYFFSPYHKPCTCLLSLM